MMTGFKQDSTFGYGKPPFLAGREISPDRPVYCLQFSVSLSLSLLACKVMEGAVLYSHPFGQCVFMLHTQ